MVQWSVVGAVSSECQCLTEQVTPDFTGRNNLGLPTQQLLEAGLEGRSPALRSATSPSGRLHG